MYAYAIIVSLWIEACPLNKSAVNSLDFVVDRFFMKPFKTNYINTVKHCQCEFNFDVPSDILAIRCERFEARYRLCDNVFCKYL